MPNREITFYYNTLTYMLANLKNKQRAFTTEGADSNNETVWGSGKGTKGWLAYKDLDGDLQVPAIQKYYDVSLSAWVRRGNVFADVEIDEIYSNIGFKDQYLADDIPISESGVTALAGGFSATSIIGALNELKSGITAADTYWAAQSGTSTRPKSPFVWIYALNGFQDQYCAGIPLAESGDGSLDGGFSAVSIIGALNEVYGSMHAFKTITGITNDVVADSVADTLSLATGNNILEIVGTTATDTITFTVDETNINHDNLSNFVANKHIDHSTVSISSGGILSGGGTIVANCTISLANGDVDHDQTLNFTSTEHFTMLNENDLGSNSDTQAATQQSIKAYVDAAIGAENLWNRAATTLSPHTAGDNVTTTGVITGNSFITASNIGIAADADLIQLTAANTVVFNATNVGIDNVAPGRLLTVGGAHDDPTISLNRSTITWTADQKTAFGCVDGEGGNLKLYSNTTGGIYHKYISKAAASGFNALFQAFSEHDLTTQGSFLFVGFKHDGSGSFTTHGASAKIFEVRNYANTLMTIKGNANTGIDNALPSRLLTVGGAHDDPTISLNRSTITWTADQKSAFGCVDGEAGNFMLRSGLVGGLDITSYSKSVSGVAIAFNACSENDLTAYGSFIFRAYKHDGSGSLTAHGNSAKIFEIRNDYNILMTILGDGNMAINGNATLASNKNIVTQGTGALYSTGVGLGETERNVADPYPRFDKDTGELYGVTPS